MKENVHELKALAEKKINEFTTFLNPEEKIEETSKFEVLEEEGDFEVMESDFEKRKSELLSKLDEYRN